MKYKILVIINTREIGASIIKFKYLRSKYLLTNTLFNNILTALLLKYVYYFIFNYHIIV